MVLYNNLNSGSFIVIFFLVILNHTLHGECVSFKIGKTEIDVVEHDLEQTVQISSKYPFCPKVSIGKTKTRDPRKNILQVNYVGLTQCHISNIHCGLS